MKILKIPALSPELELLSIKKNPENSYVQYYEQGVQAGFPSPAEDFKEQKLSLDERYLQNPEATFLIKVVGDSMQPTLLKGDILIVKSDAELSHNSIGIISVNQTDFTVKRFHKEKNCFVADNTSYPNIDIKEKPPLIW